MTQVIINDILPYTQAVATSGQTVFGTNWTANYYTDVVVYQTPYGDAPDDVTQILTDSQYSVAFIGDLNQVQVTLVTGAGAGDIITITRQTPADRENLYTNTNFTPSMLNNDFGILTLVDQQNQLVNQHIAPRYNYSALIDVPVDTILPILGENETWVKNSNNTAFIPYTLPESGVAPAGDTYVLLTPDDVGLPNAFSLSTLNTGFLVNDLTGNTLITTSFTGTANQIAVTNGDGTGGATNISIAANPIMPGTAGMGIPSGTTAQRVVPASNISLRYNTSLASLEYYTGIAWSQINDNTQVSPGLINELAWYAAAGDQVSGLPTVTAGVLTTVLGVPTWASELSLALGGTGADLTASDGGVVYSTGSALAILAGTATANLPLLSQDATAPVWGSYALALGGALTTGGAITFSGAHAFTGVLTGDTDVTFPLSGTLLSADANDNLTINNVLTGYATTATAAATTTLTVASKYQQFFTGTTTQTLELPVTSTLVLGQGFYVVNNSTGVVTVESSGGNTVQAMAAGTAAILTCIAITGTTATSWSVAYIGASSGGSSPWTAGTGTDSAFGGDGSTSAAGNYSLAYGDTGTSTSSDAADSFAMGTNTQVSSGYSFALGYECVVSGDGQSFAMGNQSQATGAYAFAFGAFAKAEANFTWAFGDSARAQNQGSVVWSDSTGAGNWDSASNQWIATYSGGFYQYVGSTLAFEIKSTGATTFLGTTAGDNASAGFVGEVISDYVPVGSPVSVSADVQTNIASVSLTDGDWDVYSNLFATGTTVSLLYGGTSSVSATLPDNSLTSYITGVSATLASPLPYQRFNVSGATTVYMVAYISGTGTINCSGSIVARRAR